jgi:hypothetical protein
MKTEMKPSTQMTCRVVLTAIKSKNVVMPKTDIQPISTYLPADGICMAEVDVEQRSRVTVCMCTIQ